MAWCPQCKNEYREGVKVCADCGCELIEEEQYGDLVPLTLGDEDKLNHLKKYLEYNKLKGVTVKKEEDGVFMLYVREKDKGPASAMGRVFLQQEYLREQEELQKEAFEQEKSEQEAFEVEEALDKEFHRSHDVAGLPFGYAGQSNSSAKKEEASEIPVMYQNSSERAEENRSSAWTLMIVGGIGLVAMLLCLFGVIPLRLGNPYMFYGVMCAVFILFIVMGVVSMKNAKIFAKKAESENTLRDAMTKWYQESLNAEKVDDGLAGEEEEIPNEILYFKRVQKIKDMFNHQFMNLDQVFLEHFIDEEVYDYIFSDTEI
uniref:hypothetical protein n=1 Tax=Acetatifactor sp. TaxID=1872090 RepID=UPI004057564A